MAAVSKELNRAALRQGENIYPGYEEACLRAREMADSIFVYPPGQDYVGNSEAKWECDYMVGIGYPEESELHTLVPTSLRDLKSLDDLSVIYATFDRTRVFVNGNRISIRKDNSVIDTVDLEVADKNELTMGERMTIALALVMPEADRMKSSLGIMFTEKVGAGPLPTMGYTATQYLFLPNEAGFLKEVKFSDEKDVKDLINSSYNGRIGILIQQESLNQTTGDN